MREYKGKSIIALPEQYVVIDTETTGLDYSFCDIIEVCAMRYVDGKCTDIFSSLVKPREQFVLDPNTGDWIPRFVDGFITELTGITNEMLAIAPEPTEIMPKLHTFIGDSVLLAHNAHFDINFLYDAMDQYCGIALRNDFIDTLRMARRVFPELEHHRLSDIAQACGITPDCSHRAEADCRAAAECYAVMRNRILAGYSEDEFARLFVYNYNDSLKSVSVTVENIDSTNPLYGKTVVFTGTLSSMTRKDAFQVVANLGGIPQDSMNEKTNYLVIGSGEFAKSVKEGKTNKMKKAEILMQKGAELSVVSESAFFDLISDYM